MFLRDELQALRATRRAALFEAIQLWARVDSAHRQQAFAQLVHAVDQLYPAELPLTTSPDEIIALLRFGLCRPDKLAAGCTLCQTKLQAIEDVKRMAEALGLTVSSAGKGHMTKQHLSARGYTAGMKLKHVAYGGAIVTLVECLSDGRWVIDRGNRKTRVSEKTLDKEYSADLAAQPRRVG